MFEAMFLKCSYPTIGEFNISDGIATNQFKCNEPDFETSFLKLREVLSKVTVAKKNINRVTPPLLQLWPTQTHRLNRPRLVQEGR